jgi:hypothetical protein
MECDVLVHDTYMWRPSVIEPCLSLLLSFKPTAQAKTVSIFCGFAHSVRTCCMAPSSWDLSRQVHGTLWVAFVPLCHLAQDTGDILASTTLRTHLGVCCGEHTAQRDSWEARKPYTQSSVTEGQARGWKRKAKTFNPLLPFIPGALWLLATLSESTWEEPIKTVPFMTQRKLVPK